jgi:hypothetical protein
MKRTMLVTAAAIATMAGAAVAAPLGLGGSVAQASFTNTPPPGTLVTSLVGVPIAPVGGVVTGTVDSWVYETATGYVFAYRVNIGQPSNSIHRTTIVGDWDYFAISDVGSTVPPPGVRPNSLDYLQSNTLGANFLGAGLGENTSSTIFWFQTDALQYRVGTIFVIDGVVGTSAGLVALIPLPSAGLMSLAGLGLVVVRRRR